MIEYAYLDNLQIHGGSNYGLINMGMGSPAPRAVADLRPSDHGATDATAYYGPRIFELIGNITAASMAALWEAADELKGSLVLGSTHTLRFRREGLTFDEQAVVRVDSPVDMPTGPMPSPLLMWGVSLLAPDPRIYTTTENSGSYDPTDSGTGGLSFPLDFPLDFGVSDTAGRLTVENEGNVSSPPTFVITGPVTNPIIDNDTTGQSIYTQDTALSTGDTLTIDTAAKTVVLNGTTSRPDLISVSLTDWFYIRPGSNQLRLRGSDMESTETELAVTFRNARI